MGSCLSGCFGGEGDEGRPARRTPAVAASTTETEEQRRARERAIEERLSQIDRRGLKTEEAVDKLRQSRSQTSNTPSIADAGLKKVEEGLEEAGFCNAVPLEERLFAAGDGDVIEDAPTGYYRFHFWKSERVPREHDNYVLASKEAGVICVSVIRGESEGAGGGYYRLLIRTIFGFKSMILTDEVLAGVFPTRLGSQQLLTIALHHFVGSERERSAAMPLGHDSFSVASGASGMSCRSERTSFLPHARLKASTACLEEMRVSAGDSLRRDSIRRRNTAPAVVSEESKQSTMPAVAKTEVSDSELQHKFRALAGTKASSLAKQFVKGEASLAHTLLAMEQALMPRHLDIDVIPLGSSSSKNACELFGHAMDVGVALQQRLQRVRPAAAAIPSPAPCTNEAALKHALKDFLEKERNYGKQLDQLDMLFCTQLPTKGIVTEYSHKQIFELVDVLARGQRRLLSDMAESDVMAELNVTSVCEALAQALGETTDLHRAYREYCKGQSKREESLKEEIARNQAFGQFCEDAYARRAFGLLKLDQVLMAPVQRLTRYRMHLVEILQCLGEDHPSLPSVQKALEAASHLAAVTDAQVEAEKGLIQLMRLQSRLKGLPPAYCSPTSNRFYVRQLQLVEAEGQKHLLYLLSDTLLLAARTEEKKTKKKRWVVERVSAVPQEILLIGAPLKRIRLSNIGSNLEISVAPGDDAELMGEANSLYRFALSHPEELPAFMADFDALRQASNSGKKRHVSTLAGLELHFHMHAGLEDYQADPNRHDMALLVLDGAPLPNLSCLAGLRALGVLQSRGGTFRGSLKYGGPVLYMAQDTFKAKRDFVPAATFRATLLQALSSCARLLEMYPPFSPATQHQRRAQLETLSQAASVTSLTKRLGKLFSNKKKAEGSDEMAQRLWDDSMSCFAASIDGSIDEREAEEEGVPRSLASAPLSPFSAPISPFSAPIVKRTPTKAKTTSPLAYYDDDNFLPY